MKVRLAVAWVCLAALLTSCEAETEMRQRAQLDIKKLETACDLLKLTKGRAPLDVAELAEYAPTRVVTERESVTRSVTTRESTLALVDPWGTPYAITAAPPSGLCSFRSFGPDRKEQTADDVLAWSP